MTLRNGKPGMIVSIDKINGSELKERLMTMGFIPGTKVRILHSAPMGDPMSFGIRGYNIAMRVSDAEKIEVSKAN